MRRLLVPSALIGACACAAASEPVTEDARTPPAPAACSLPEADRAWLDRALEAWRFACREISGIERLPRNRVILFSADCALTSDDALTSPTAEGVTWTAAPHSGTITTPEGKDIPVGATTFAAGGPELRYFAMSTPSVWTAAGIGEGPDLEVTMIAVLLHEASHVAQIGPYGPRLGALIERYDLPDSFNDDAVEENFKTNPEFAASVERETRLFLLAAAEPDDTEAMLKADEARELMRARQARWCVGDLAYLVEAEDLWLTFEGSGQWVGHQWLVRSGAQSQAETLRRLGRGPWSQTEGFALVLALDRIVGPTWKRHAFGDGEKSVLEMLDAALAE